MRFKFKDHPYYINLPCTEKSIEALCKSLKIENNSNTTVSVEDISGDERARLVFKDNTYNLDRLNFLTKLIDSLSENESNTFYALAYITKVKDIKNLINLTYNLNNVTLADNFYDMEEIGKRMYLNAIGGASVKDLESFNGKEYFQNAVRGGMEHAITPYGILFKHDEAYFEEVFDGVHFPFFDYENSIGNINLNYQGDKEYLFLPFRKTELNKALERLGAKSIEDCSVSLDFPRMTDNVYSAIIGDDEVKNKVNEICSFAERYINMNNDRCKKLDLLVESFEPKNQAELYMIMDNLDEFVVYPNIQNENEYGQYIINEKEKLYYNNGPLAEYIDYEGCGRKFKNQENGVFTEKGYVSYFGYKEELSEMLSKVGLKPLEKEMSQLKLYMPLLAETSFSDDYGNEHERIMDSSELCEYESAIKKAIDRYDEDMNSRGLMEYYNLPDTVNAKADRVSFDVEIIDNELMGVADITLNAPLNSTELFLLKSYIEGQASDGWGEGFEQREISGDDFGFYVSFWQAGDWELKSIDELGHKQNQELSMGGM